MVLDNNFEQEDLQDIKKQFCDIYAKNCKNRINTITSLLLKKDI